MNIFSLNFLFLSILIHISKESNLDKINLGKKYNIKTNKEYNLTLSIKEEKYDNKDKEIDENVIVNLVESYLTNLTIKYENELQNLNNKINNIINSSLISQNEMIQKVKNEKKEIKNMQTEIQLLNERYKQNMMHTYILSGVIFSIFLVFCFIDILKINNNQGNGPSEYHKAVDDQNISNQLSID